jgi:hypothetical protein
MLLETRVKVSPSAEAEEGRIQNKEMKNEKRRMKNGE